MNILSVNFNNDRSLAILGTQSGFIVYQLVPSLSRSVTRRFNGGVDKVFILNKTNMIIFVPGGEKPFNNKSKDRVITWDEAEGNITTEFGSYNNKTPVLNVFMTISYIFTIYEKKIELITFPKHESIGTITTYPNPNGIYSMCVDPIDNNLETKVTIATLGLKKGEIAIWKPKNKKKDDYIQIETPHRGNITVIELSRDGKIVATASENGTSIYVFDVNTKEILFKLRRGTNIYYNVGIHDISIRHDNKYLACCSTNGTIHIFDLNQNIEQNKNIKSMFSYPGSYISEYFESNWSCKPHSTGTNDCKMRCTFDYKNTLHVFTFQDDYYRIDGENYETMIRNKLKTNI